MSNNNADKDTEVTDSDNWLNNMDEIFQKAYAEDLLQNHGERIDVHEASKNGDVDQVVKFLSQGNSTETRDRDHWVPLHMSSYWNQVEVTQLLLDRNADVSAVDTQLYTPLHWSAANGHMEAIQLLLDHGAVPDARCSAGATPLTLACSGGHLEAARLLINLGNDVDINSCTTTTKKTPLHNACYHGMPHIVELLLQHGALQTLDAAGNMPGELFSSMASLDARGRIKKMLEQSLAGESISDETVPETDN